MQKFLNNLIFRIVQDSSVSYTSHHPQFGEEGNWSHLVYSNTPYVLWKKSEEILGTVANIWRLGVPGKCWQHPQAGSTFARNQCEG
jgi:hypothetical protein